MCDLLSIAYILYAIGFYKTERLTLGDEQEEKIGS